jgi:hypothetical protein
MVDVGHFRWNIEKSAWLKAERGIGFEDIVEALASGQFIAEIAHPKKAHQFIYVIEFKGYVYSVPFVKDGEDHFLKTIFPDRKLFAKYARLQ